LIVGRYENPFLYIDFFAVENEWGVMVEASPQFPVIITQADVGYLSVCVVVAGPCAHSRRLGGLL
jgi:hypothetical protein